MAGISLILIACALVLGYIGFLRITGFSDFRRIVAPAIPETSVASEDHVTERYRKSGLSENEAQKLLQQLNLMMDIDKPYLDEGLNLKSLADALNTTTHKLSQVLNEQRGLTFFEYVNDYRVEEVKKRLKEPANQSYTLQAIAYDSGFCSKSNFYTSFRKNTGMTPGNYLKQSGLTN